jgi:hypothetical protein
LSWLLLLPLLEALRLQQPFHQLLQACRVGQVQMRHLQQH